MTAIHSKSSSLIIKAGSWAREHILKNDLNAADVGILPGGAGGPKGVGILGLDRAIFGDFLPQAKRRRTLVGSSVGCWRFAAVASGTNAAESVSHLERLAHLYTEQRFPKGIKRDGISAQCRKMLHDVLDGNEGNILSNSDWRLVAATDRSRGLLASENPLSLILGIIGFAFTNLVSRKATGRFADRVLAAVGTEALPIGHDGLFPIKQSSITADNLHDFLMASASIPLVLEGVSKIADAPDGIYRDGGLLDYHLDLAWQDEGIVLYPHFTDRIIPGWFDKLLKWRNGDAQRQSHTLLIAPSEEYLQSLPNGKLPNRADFKTYAGNDEARISYWNKAIAESERLGDEFRELLATGRIGERLQPI